MSSVLLEQQVNLHQPIFGAQRRLFSARAMAVAILVFAVALAGMAAFAGARARRVERSLEALQRQQDNALELAGRASASVRPGRSLAQLDAEAKMLSAQIDARERAIGSIRNGDPGIHAGFAARMRALAARGVEGLWLTRLAMGAGPGELALRGATTDSSLVPSFIGGLAGESALAGVRLDRLDIRRAAPDAAPAQWVFEVQGPDLALPAADKPDAEPPR